MMSEPPTWVRKRDGRVEPFDPERISQSVYTAAERLRKHDVFFARELTTGITHFLAEETEGRTVTTEQISEIVVKIVRELGHPQLARILEETDQTVEMVQAEPTSTKQDIYSPEILRAVEEHLLDLGNLDHPNRFAGGLIETESTSTSFLQQLAEAKRVFGAVFILDSLESLLQNSSLSISQTLLDLQSIAELADVDIIANVGASTVSTDTSSPLFPIEPGDSSHELDLINAISQRQAYDRIVFDWHLSKEDFQSTQRAKLVKIAKMVTVGAPIRFVFDRPRLPTQLAEGVDKQHPLIIQNVGIHLPQLATLLDGVDTQFFEKKLQSLTRMALGAGIQKRNHLRQQSRELPALGRGFLIQKARLIVSPLGLGKAVQQLSGWNICHSDEARQVANQWLECIQKTINEESRISSMEVCLSSPLGVDCHQLSKEAGITCWDAQSPAITQIETIGSLQSKTIRGTGTVLLQEYPSAEQLVEWLQKAWKQDITRMQFIHAPMEVGQIFHLPS